MRRKPRQVRDLIDVGRARSAGARGHRPQCPISRGCTLTPGRPSRDISRSRRPQFGQAPVSRAFPLFSPPPTTSRSLRHGGYRHPCRSGLARRSKFPMRPISRHPARPAWAFLETARLSVHRRRRWEGEGSWARERPLHVIELRARARARSGRRRNPIRDASRSDLPESRKIDHRSFRPAQRPSPPFQVEPPFRSIRQSFKRFVRHRR